MVSAQMVGLLSWADLTTPRTLRRWINSYSSGHDHTLEILGLARSIARKEESVWDLGLGWEIFESPLGCA